MAFGIYKPGQGKYARATTGLLLLLLAAYGASALRGTLHNATWGWWTSKSVTPDQVIPTVIFLVAVTGMAWLLNYPKFADFLIETEIEMGRVIWPTRKSVIGSSVVVIVTMVAMSAVLAGVDYLLYKLMQLVGIY